MEPNIVCKSSTFRHGVTEAGIYWAFSAALYDLPDDEEKRLADSVMVK